MSAQNVTGQLNFSANFQQTGVFGVIASQTLNQILSQSYQYINGTGVALGVDQLYGATLTLAASATTLHFETATLKDPFGNTLAMLRIREFIVLNTTVTGGFDLKVESSASNGIAWIPPSTSPLFARANNGFIRISDPYTFGAAAGNFITATTDGVTLDPGANTIVAAVLALGCSVA